MTSIIHLGPGLLSGTVDAGPNARIARANDHACLIEPAGCTKETAYPSDALGVARANGLACILDSAGGTLVTTRRASSRADGE
eukprot:6463007-Amphidinium_carterae.1